MSIDRYAESEMPRTNNRQLPERRCALRLVFLSGAGARGSGLHHLRRHCVALVLAPLRQKDARRLRRGLAGAGVHGLARLAARCLGRSCRTRQRGCHVVRRVAGRRFGALAALQRGMRAQASVQARDAAAMLWG